jgi:hypothetical protein
MFILLQRYHIYVTYVNMSVGYIILVGVRIETKI